MTLTQQLASKEGREEFILNNMALVSQRVKKFLNRYPHLGYLKHDIRSAGTCGLVEAVNALAKDASPNSVGLYLTFAIGRAIKQAVDREDAIYIPTRTKNRRRRNGEKLTHGPKALDLKGPVIVTSLKLEPPTRHPQLIDLWDELYGICKDDREKEILKLKSEGYSDMEIGDAVGVHRSGVSRILKDIEKRFYGD